MTFYVTLTTKVRARLQQTVIETAKTLPGAVRMARALARQRFSQPELVRDQTLAGGYWKEAEPGGETEGDTITVEPNKADTQ